MLIAVLSGARPALTLEPLLSAQSAIPISASSTSNATISPSHALVTAPRVCHPLTVLLVPPDTSLSEGTASPETKSAPLAASSAILRSPVLAAKMAPP